MFIEENMEFAGISLFAFVIAMLVVVGFHEYGHFITARLIGIKVLKFSIGFGPKLFGWTSKKSNIEYAISALPLGGYVKMLDEGAIESHEKFTESDLKQSFNRAPLWKKALVVFNGPGFNFILAVFIYTMLNLGGKTMQVPIVGHSLGWAQEQGIKSGDTLISVNGSSVNSWYEGVLSIAGSIGSEAVEVKLMQDGYVKDLSVDMSSITLDRKDKDLLGKIGIIPVQHMMSNEVAAVSEDTPASEVGLKPGDLIVSINEHKTEYFHEAGLILKGLPGQKITLIIERDGSKLTLMPTLGGDASLEAGSSNVGRLGYSPKYPLPKDGWFINKEMNLIESFTESINDTWRITETTLKFLGKMITGDISPTAISGPVGIAKVAGNSAMQGIAPFFAMIAFLSVNLMIINLLPIPALDGGHLAQYCVESITGPIPVNIQTILTYLGGGLLMMLMAFAIGLDIFDLFS